MSSTQKKRLDKVLGNATARQIALLHIKENIAEFDSLLHYAKAWCEKATGENPRDHVSRQVKESVRTALNLGSFIKREDASRIYKAQMEADLLMLLMLEVNSRIEEQHRIQFSQIGILAERLKSIVSQGSINSELQNWHMQAILCMNKVLVLKGAIEKIEKKYFWEQAILFKWEAAILKEQITFMEEMFDCYSGVAHRSGSESNVLTENMSEDFRSYRPVVGAMNKIDMSDSLPSQIAEKADYFIKISKAKTLSDFDKLKEARDLIVPYIAGEISE